ncbi:MAG: hypothetical protein JWN46_882 [Acidimicrobiales bacterium]|nr:hypothetical protein [Acidimicrobiales bacterium]
MTDMSEQEILNAVDARGRRAAATVRAALAERDVPRFRPDGGVSLRAASAGSAPSGAPPSVVALPAPVDGPGAPAAPWRRLAAVAAVVVLMVAAAAVWTLARSNHDERPAGVTTPEPRPHVATWLPAGFRLVGAGGSTTTGVAPPFGPLSLFGTDLDHPHLGVLLLPRGATPGNAGSGTLQVDVAGQKGYLLHGGSGVSTLGASVHGRVVVLLAKDVDDRALVRLAGTVSVHGTRAGLDAGALPAGWRALGEDPQPALYGALSSISGFAGIGAAYEAGTGSVASGSNQSPLVAVTTVRGDDVALAVARLVGGPAEVVSVGGRRAVVTDNRFMTGSTPLVVTWVDRPGEVVQVAGTNVGRADLVRVAQGVRVASDQEWRELGRRTNLGELSPSPGTVEVGRGTFPSGIAWVLFAKPAPAGDGGSASPDLRVDVTAAGSAVSASGSTVGSGPDQSPGLRSTTATLTTGGHRFVYGLAGPRLARVQLRSAGGIVAEGAAVGTGATRGWAFEIPPTIADGAVLQLVGLAADGSPAGTASVSAPGRSAGGSGSSTVSGSGRGRGSTSPSPSPSPTSR